MLNGSAQLATRTTPTQVTKFGSQQLDKGTS